MQVYKLQKFAGKRIILALVSVFFCTVFSPLLTAQEQIEMPKMPDMPEITPPKLGDDFYKPVIPLKKQTENKDKDKNVSGTGTNDAVIKDGTSTDDYLKSLLTGSNLLSASDITSLYDSGLFNNVSSIADSGLTNYTTQASTNLLLQQILTNLNELKTEQKKKSDAEKEQLYLYQQDTQTFKKREPSILRFKINGYNIADSLTTVFFSEPESDGTFLLTADRKYFANQKARNETFYLLFKSVKSNGAMTTFNVIPSIAQDIKNTGSYVYKLCQKQNITAEKTGNLVIIHYQDGDFSTDMLLDIDCKD